MIRGSLSYLVWPTAQLTSPPRGSRLLFTWPTYFAAGGVDALNLKEVFANRVSDDRRQHKELITCGATGMLRKLSVTPGGSPGSSGA